MDRVEGACQMFQERNEPTIHPSNESAGLTPPHEVEIQRDDELLSIEAAARRAGVARATVLGWIRNGFIDARTSKRGWEVRAGDIEPALQAANEARLGLHRDDMGRTGHAGSQDEEQAVDLVRDDATAAAVAQSPEPYLAPFAEFVREQADIVQEQAETIGWLQAELRKTREELAALRHNPPEAGQENLSTPEPADSQNVTPDFQAAPAEVPPAHDEALEPSSLYDIIAADPFSDEADNARKMIEESERKISALWEEQVQQQQHHSRPQPSRQPDDDRWLRRLVTSWKRQTTG